MRPATPATSPGTTAGTEGAPAAGQGAPAADEEPVPAAESALALVTSRLPGGERRPQQEAMARAVETAIASGRHLVVQAGTGTGKSLGYLVPAVLSGRKVVVATATKALQDQLAEKDLPLLAEALPRPFTFAVLKGRSNYLCRQRAEEIAAAGLQQSLAVGSGEGAGEQAEDGGSAASATTNDDDEDPGRLVDQVRRLLRWSSVTGTGDRAELPFEPSPRAWAMLSVGPRECPGAFRCPSGGRCFAEAARAAAVAADVVVVNTHLYGAHLASGGAVLPPHDVVVFDEAHELELVMTESLGVELSPGRLRALSLLARPLLAGRPAEDALEQLGDGASRLQAELVDRVGSRVLVADGDAELARVLSLCQTRVARVVAELRRSVSQPSLGRESDGETGGVLDGGGRHQRALGAAGHLTEDLQRLAGRTEDQVAWVDGVRRAPLLRLSPIDVAPTLAGTLWGEVTAVLTSATIPLRTPERLGLDGFAVDQLDVGSPFDYRGHSLLYVARHLPDRRDPRSETALHEELELLVRAAGGRTLALFTSRRATEAAATALAPRLPYRLLVQGELPKGRLLEQFAGEETSCLFATLGFWQGVDVPGRALSLVTLDRLPFARPDEPLFEARRERAGEAAFRLVDLPRAAMLLAQGAGRLIRSAEDRGVVAVLDPRLATAGYRATLLAGLPPMRRTTDRRQVVDFLDRVLSAAPA